MYLDTYAIVVSFNPVMKDLFRLCQVLDNANINVLVIDNSELENVIFDEFSTLNNFTAIKLFSNHGIANAQNIGIRHALARNAKYIIFFDQDSIINANFLFHLLDPFKNDEVKISAPLFVDTKSNIFIPVYRVNHIGVLSRSNIENIDISNNFVVISSGMAVKREVFDVVGLMKEEYFIDYVDTDFCFRCFSNKIKIYINKKAIMNHSVGDRLIPFMGFNFFVHKASRVYYQTRNLILFSRKNYVPLIYRLRELLSFFFHQIILLLFIYRNKQQYLKALAYGLSDGLKGISGKISSKSHIQ